MQVVVIWPWNARCEINTSPSLWSFELPHSHWFQIDKSKYQYWCILVCLGTSGHNKNYRLFSLQYFQNVSFQHRNITVLKCRIAFFDFLSCPQIYSTRKWSLSGHIISLYKKRRALKISILVRNAYLSNLPKYYLGNLGSIILTRHCIQELGKRGVREFYIGIEHFLGLYKIAQRAGGHIFNSAQYIAQA